MRNKKINIESKRYFKRLLLSTSLILIFIFTHCKIFAGEDTKIKDLKFSGPYTYKNLSIYLIHGKNKIKGDKFLTLSEAMRQKKAIVHETGNVNELSIENVSDDESIFIQAGDIVKGGKQDRVFSTDMVLSARSGKVNIAAFCVEQGRWSKRSGEKLETFSGSGFSISAKKLKIAVRYKKTQSEVWDNVSKEQFKLNRALDTSVNAEKSVSSYQLSLENKTLKKSKQEYKNALLKLANSKNDTLGFAFSINGQVNSADVYASHTLFLKLWSKLFDAAVTEAVGEYKNNKKFTSPAQKEVIKWYRDAALKKKEDKRANKRTRIKILESDENYASETFDDAESPVMLHKSIIKK